MITNINEILVEWAYRTRDGKPNSKSMSHQIILEGVLKDFGWSREERSELIGNLMEARTGNYVKNKYNDRHGLTGKPYGTKPTKPDGKDKDGAGEEDGSGKGKKKGSQEEPEEKAKDSEKKSEPQKPSEIDA